MQRIFLAILCICWALGSKAQQIQGMEYAFDTDPGPGNATYVAITPAAAVDDVFHLNTTSLSLGVHTVFFRFKDTSGDWSTSQSKQFFLTSGNNNYAKPIITAFDYFLDSLNSTHYTYTFPPNTQSYNDTVTLSFPGAMPGLHTLYIRTNSINNLNSHYVAKPVFLTSGTVNSQMANITALEYSLDTSNTWTSLPVTPAAGSIDDTIHLNFSSSQVGLHTLHTRVRNDADWYSHYQSRSFMIMDGSSSDSIISAEVFFDTDPGFGNGTQVALNAAPEVDTTFTITVPSGLSAADHILYVRTKDNAGNYSTYMADTVKICSVLPPVAGFDKVRFGNTFSFIDTSKHAQNYLWDFGDSTTDSVSNPLHDFPHPGVFTVKQRVENSCHYAEDSIDLSVSGIEYYTPTMSGKGNCIFEVFGGNLDTGMVFRLIDNVGNIYEPFDKLASEKGTYYSCVVDLHNANTGIYTLEIQTEDSTFIFANGFTLEEFVPSLRTQILGRGVVRGLVDNFYTVRVHNDGNTNAGSAMVSVNIPNGVILTYLDTLLLSDSAIALGADTIPEYIALTTANGVSTDGKLYQYIVYNIPAGGYVDLPFTLNFSLGNKSIYAGVSGPYSGSPWFPWIDDCWKAKISLGYTIVSSVALAIPVADCATAGLKTLFDGANIGISGLLQGGLSNGEAAVAATSVVKNLASMAAQCGGEFSTPVGLGVELAYDITAGLADISSAYITMQEACPEESNEDRKNTSVRTSLDPNAIYGPSGFGEAHFIKGDKKLDYSIFFENVDSATLAAQKVVVIDTLDSNVFDFSTFTLGGFGIGTKSFYIPMNRKEFTSNYQLATDNYIRANLKFDTLTGVLSCSFFSLDSTGEVLSDPLGGFLPPNVIPPNGEGFVYYTIGLKENLPDETIISNKASIVFDNNEAIETEPWINTLDLHIPESTIAGTTVQNDTVISFNINGDDMNGSQVYYYDLYISKDNSPYEKSRKIINNASFHGEYGHQYSFYIEAVDSVGHREHKTPVAEATVTLQPTGIHAPDVQEEEIAFRCYPVPSKGNVSILLTKEVHGPVTVNIYDIAGTKVFIKRQNLQSGKSCSLNLNMLSDGMYFVEVLKDERQSLGKQKIVLVK
ncbi:T9SS type A sorting domain-containing protein [Taibaiella lutea]|uniref:T9SS type A sorting domain-containing protein n=1 Tax=Taibaiella lutea TaxID=2608001 RepID=A0A5M6CIC6_9BACT|nr:T9SS type A sorting domain-containing protein [Taibaiella lutea]KAA5534961.1 T9SS type A sorting domain-containing protein [Taibaiella lutea]